MADMCENELTIWGKKKALKRFRRVADERKLPLSERDPFRGVHEPSILSFHRLMPIPPDVVARGYDPPHSGYDWETKHWGVKWGACNAKKKKSKPVNGAVGLYYTYYTFDTGWFPPTSFVKKISKKFPALTFTLNFLAPASGWHGDQSYRSGKKTDEYL